MEERIGWLTSPRGLVTHIVPINAANTWTCHFFFLLQVLTLIPQDYEVRLVDGRNTNEGRLEVLVDGKWGTVCSQGWTLLEALVVCQQTGLGYAQMAVQVNGAFHGQLNEKSETIHLT